MRTCTKCKNVLSTFHFSYSGLKAIHNGKTIKLRHYKCKNCQNKYYKAWYKCTKRGRA